MRKSDVEFHSDGCGRRAHPAINVKCYHYPRTQQIADHFKCDSEGARCWLRRCGARMKTLILESYKDDNTGEIGLAIPGMPRDDTTNASIDGLSIAHDLLEHVNGPENIGGITDELEALGAIWYIRGQHGELTRDGRDSMYSIAENIASDVCRMFRDHVDGAQYVDYSPCRSGPVTHDADIQATLDHADDKWRHEFSGEDETEPHVPAWLRYRAVCLNRMRRGYAKARRRWERHGRYAAHSQFWAIVEAVTPYLKRIEYEGAQFKLQYGERDGERVAFCEEHYPEEY